MKNIHLNNHFNSIPFHYTISFHSNLRLSHKVCNKLSPANTNVLLGFTNASNSHGKELLGFGEMQQQFSLILKLLYRRR